MLAHWFSCQQVMCDIFPKKALVHVFLNPGFLLEFY